MPAMMPPLIVIAIYAVRFTLLPAICCHADMMLFRLRCCAPWRYAADVSLSSIAITPPLFDARAAEFAVFMPY